MSDHGGSGGQGGPIAGQPESALTDAEQARTLVGRAGLGSLGTLTETGHPFGSVAAYVTDAAGQPLFCISEMAEHTRNARRDERASLLVAEGFAGEGDPLAAGRVTLVGSLVLLDQAEVAEAREVFLRHHPAASVYVDFNDFGWWRLAVDDARYVGGFGRMSWVDADSYRAAVPDEIAAFADGIIEHMNADHADANLAYVRAFAGVRDATSARLVGVDRRGLDLVAATPGGQVTARVAFSSPVDEVAGVRPAVVAMLGEARALLAADEASAR